MKNWSISLNQKRFLIVWLGVCLFALFLNVANVGGKIELTNGEPQYIFFDNSDPYGHGYEDDFYPFTEFISDNLLQYPDITFDMYKRGTYTRFNGIFNSYNLPEFIFYSILGLSIIFLPKLWK